MVKIKKKKRNIEIPNSLIEQSLNIILISILNIILIWYIGILHICLPEKNFLKASPHSTSITLSLIDY